MSPLSGQLLQVVTDAAPTIEVFHGHQGGSWTVKFGEARLGLSASVPWHQRVWDRWKDPSLDIVAYATINVTMPPDQHDYEGRSHSLYFCDAVRPQEYRWYETAFMRNPRRSVGHKGRYNSPMALTPSTLVQEALGPHDAEYQVAWPFTELAGGDLDEDFAERWTGWFASAVEGCLAEPSIMPERPVAGTWRWG